MWLSISSLGYGSGQYHKKCFQMKCSGEIVINIAVDYNSWVLLVDLVEHESFVGPMPTNALIAWPHFILLSLKL